MPSLALDDDRLIRMALANGLDAVGIAPVVLVRLMTQATADLAPANDPALAPQREPTSTHPHERHDVRRGSTH